MAETKKMVPKRRFKGFTEDWEECDLNDTANFIDGNYGEKYPKEKEFLSAGIPFFTSAVIGTTGIFNYRNVKFISIEKNNILVKAQSRGGDLILTNRGASMGVLAQIPEKYTDVNIGPQLTRIRGKAGIDNLFLLSMLRTSHNNKRILSLNAGSAMSFVGLDALGKFEYLKPSYTEQQKIGKFFKKLDKQITLQQRKLEKIQAMKKAYLSEMFPAAGETKPKRRFKGFTDDWVEKKVLDIAPLQRGFDLPKHQMIEGNVPLVTSNGVNGYHSEYKEKGPGVITGRSGTIGKVHYIEGVYWPHNTTLWVTDFKGNYPLYIYYMYSRFGLNKYGTGSGVPTLNRNDVHDKYEALPVHDEQIKIAEFFSSLDNQITLHRQKLDKLKKLKKAYLNEMFI